MVDISQKKSDILNWINKNLDANSLQGIDVQFFDYVALSARDMDSLSSDSWLTSALVKAWEVYLNAHEEWEKPHYLNDSVYGSWFIERLMKFYEEWLDTTDTVFEYPVSDFTNFLSNKLKSSDLVKKVSYIESVDIAWSWKAFLTKCTIDWVDISVKFVLKNNEWLLSLQDVIFDHSLDSSWRFDLWSTFRTINKHSTRIESLLQSSLWNYLHSKNISWVQQTRIEWDTLVVTESNRGAWLLKNPESMKYTLHTHMLEKNWIETSDWVSILEYGILIIMNNIFLQGGKWTIVSIDELLPYCNNQSTWIAVIIEKLLEKWLIEKVWENNWWEFKRVGDISEYIESRHVEQKEDLSLWKEKRSFFWWLAQKLENTKINFKAALNSHDMPKEIREAKANSSHVSPTPISFDDNWISNDLWKNNGFAYSSNYLNTLASRLYMEFTFASLNKSNSAKEQSEKAQIEKILQMIKKNGVQSFLSIQWDDLFSSLKAECNSNTFAAVEELLVWTIRHIQVLQRDLFEKSPRSNSIMSARIHDFVESNFSDESLKKYYSSNLHESIQWNISQEDFQEEILKLLDKSVDDYNHDFIFEICLKNLLEKKRESILRSWMCENFESDSDVEEKFWWFFQSALESSNTIVDTDIWSLLYHIWEDTFQIDKTSLDLFYNQWFRSIKINFKEEWIVEFWIEMQWESLFMKNSTKFSIQEIIKQIIADKRLSTMQKTMAISLFFNRFKTQLWGEYMINDFAFDDEEWFAYDSPTITAWEHVLSTWNMYVQWSLNDMMHYLSLFIQGEMKALNLKWNEILDDFDDLNITWFTETDDFNEEWREAISGEEYFWGIINVSEEKELLKVPKKEWLWYFSFHRQWKFSHFYDNGKYYIAEISSAWTFDPESPSYKEYNTFNEYLSENLNLQLMKKYLAKFVAMYMDHPLSREKNRHCFIQLPTNQRVEISPWWEEPSRKLVTNPDWIDQLVAAHYWDPNKHVSVFWDPENPVVILDRDVVVEDTSNKKKSFFWKMFSKTEYIKQSYDYESLNTQRGNFDMNKCLANPAFAQNLVNQLLNSIK